MSARFTRNVGPHATASAIASDAQKRRSARPASSAPGQSEQHRVVDDLHRHDREGVGDERDADRRAERRPGAQQRDQRQRVAEQEREPDRERDRSRVPEAPPGREHHAEHLADPAAREAVVRRARRETIHAHGGETNLRAAWRPNARRAPSRRSSPSSPAAPPATRGSTRWRARAIALAHARRRGDRSSRSPRSAGARCAATRRSAEASSAPRSRTASSSGCCHSRSCSCSRSR